MKSRGISILETLAVLGVIAVLASILVPNFMRAKSRGQLTACKSNLKNIGTGCEMYSEDWKGAFPHNLAQLTPNYLKTIPECPYAKRDTYSKSYRLETMRVDLILCKGHQEQDSDDCYAKRAALRQQLAGRDTPAEPKDLDPADLLCPQGETYEYLAYSPTYNFQCQGENHTSTSVPPNYPQYNGADGLVER